MSTTTFDYIPRIILGKSNSYIYNSINLVIRAIAFYIYFKTTDKLDILQLILAYVFPIIYIFYKISETNTDYILGLFLSTGDGEKCIERRGASFGSTEPGNLKSIPEDFKECNSVELNTTKTRDNCLNIRSVGDPDDKDMYPKGVQACLYIPKDQNKYNYRQFNCSNYENRSDCNSQEDNNNQQLCNWNQASSNQCQKDRIKFDIPDSATRQQCPTSCKWDVDNGGCTTINRTPSDIPGLLSGKCMER